MGQVLARHPGRDFLLVFNQFVFDTMSLHWTLIAGFLYGEIGVLFILLIPFISNKRWRQLFKSRFLKGIDSQFIYYFYILVAILILFFLDAIREMNKYGDEQDHNQQNHGDRHLDTQMQMHMRLFRAQRNFYISGFALMLTLVIKRMVSLITENATLDIEKEAAMKQAQSASRAAETLMGDSETEKKLKAKDEELSKALKDVESMKSQSENLTKEYDRLLEEKDRLERKLRILDGEGAGGDKKDD